MNIETLSEHSGSPITQSLDAVVVLLNSLNRPIEPLPEVVDLDTVKLVQSNKGDVYYTMTAKECSCPSFVYRGGPCKHQRKHFAEDKKRGQTIAETLEEHDRNLHRMPKSYQRMVRAARPISIHWRWICIGIARISAPTAMSSGTNKRNCHHTDRT